MKTIEEQIRQYIVENFLFSGDGYPYADDVSFLNEGIIDSMNVLQLVMFVEENFKIKIADQDVIPDNFDSVSRLAAFVRSKASTAS